MDRDHGTADASSLGDTFRRERDRRHLSLEQVAVSTKIRITTLRAIERGAIDELPHSVFAIGLVQSYAHFLNLDCHGYVRALQASQIRDATRVRGRVATSTSRRSRSAPNILLAAVIGIVLLILFGYLYGEYSAFASGASIAIAQEPPDARRISTPLPAPPPEPAATAQGLPDIQNSVQPATATSVPLLTPTAALPTREPSPTAVHGVRIEASTIGRVWVQVEADGKVSFVGIINAGEKRTWTATDKLLLWAGNAGNISVTFNGRSLGALGAPGEVIKVTWTATG